MTRRVITFDSELNEINTITLDRELRSRDISAVEIELRELIPEDGGDGESTWPNTLVMPANGYGIVDYNPNL